ncbi:MAG: class I SAM-dependent methyltransferase [Gemmatimonadaceae bacterium]
MHLTFSVRIQEAADFIRSAVAARGSMWADLGAGAGVFTRALVQLLGADSRIYAIERAEDAVASLTAWATAEAPNVTVIQADFTAQLNLPELDGIVLANALHFVPDPAKVLAQLVTLLRPGGRVVLVEYDRRESSRWVPHPIPIASLRALADAAGLGRPTVAESRPSEYGGILYAAYADRKADNQMENSPSR